MSDVDRKLVKKTMLDGIVFTLYLALYRYSFNLPNSE